MPFQVSILSMSCVTVWRRRSSRPNPTSGDEPVEILLDQLDQATRRKRRRRVAGRSSFAFARSDYRFQWTIAGGDSHRVRLMPQAHVARPVRAFRSVFLRSPLAPPVPPHLRPPLRPLASATASGAAGKTADPRSGRFLQGWPARVRAKTCGRSALLMWPFVHRGSPPAPWASLRVIVHLQRAFSSGMAACLGSTLVIGHHLASSSLCPSPALDRVAQAAPRRTPTLFSRAGTGSGAAARRTHAAPRRRVARRIAQLLAHPLARSPTQG